MPKLTQILPGTRIIPRLSVPIDVADKLRDIASRAFAGEYEGSSHQAPFVVIFAVARAQSAAEEYVSEKEFQTALTDFRRMLTGRNSLRHAVQQLYDRLSWEAAPPFEQMRRLYCYGDPNLDGLEPGDDSTRKLQRERETVWNCRHRPGEFGRTLQLWLKLMDSLKADAGMGRSPIAAEKQFVSRLAFYWTNELEAEIPNSRGPRKPDEGAVVNRQKGLFADFVRTAVKIIPPEYLRGVRWDHALRSIHVRENS
jgi:hypothetical protein